jgi:hypothetical protein
MTIHHQTSAHIHLDPLFAEPSTPAARRRFGLTELAMGGVFAAAVIGCGNESEPDPTPEETRELIGGAIPGGLANLMVPATDAEIPVPPAPQGYAGRYDTTEAKRYLGKLIFHDPIRTQRVNINAGQPLDFPAATAFGGTIGVTDSDAGTPPADTYANTTTANVEAVGLQTSKTGSSASRRSRNFRSTAFLVTA